MERWSEYVNSDASAAWAYRRSRPPIPTDRDHLFRSIPTSVARVLTTPLDDGGEVILLMAGQAQREAVPVANRRDPRVTRSALTAGAAARAGGPVDPPGPANAEAQP
jgi:hypothetical protein